MQSQTILERFRTGYHKDIDLTLRPAYRAFLQKLGNPHLKLPPVFHVAGTNGKGSVCAFLRAMLEAEGYRVHVYTSPHLVQFHERIRIAGKIIGEDELAEILGACERAAEIGTLSYFEAATAAAFAAFARHKADFTILEVGLGGRLDATNVVEHPLASIITRISYDHREYLGETLDGIANEKAGIMKKGVPCFVAMQPANEARTALRVAAKKIGAPLFMGGEDWRVEPTENGFRFSDAAHTFDLPKPALLGVHQFDNAGLAIAALAAVKNPLAPESIRQGLHTVEWPARLQKLENGGLRALLPRDWELWLDGGHNDSAGDALAAQAESWHAQDSLPLYLICGMLTTKNPGEFLRPLAPFVSALRAVSIPGEALTFTADDFAACAKEAGMRNVAPTANVSAALRDVARDKSRGRILICGSLYLAGHVLKENSG
jgi:dihydrofolate synthase/folylpolyglutamate synthase